MLAADADGGRIALRTSGSTGTPREVVRTAASWSASFAPVAELTGLSSSSVLWLPGPLSATMNLFAATLARWRGARVSAHRQDASHAHLTPSQLTALLDAGAEVRGLHLTVAGERLASGLRDRATTAGAVVDHYYGAAELSFVAWGTCERDLRPFPEVTVELREEEIWVRSPYVCEGYRGEPGALRRDAGGFATVGDRGSLEDGVLTVRGRGSDAVTSGAATVLVADVERALAPALSGQLAVVGTPHPALGQVVTAALTSAADLAPADALARTSLAPQLRPRRWFEVAALPMTPAGKVDRVALAEALAAGRARRLNPTGPRPPTTASGARR